jgi:hypothetical protein
MIYLTGASNAGTRALAPDYPVGVMAQPGNGYLRQVQAYRWWAADNGCFAQGERFRFEAFYRWLAAGEEHYEHCLFAVVPDVVYDADATTALFERYGPQMRELPYPLAYVLQNGITVASVPWQRLDVVFIGGDTAWKLGPVAAEIAAEAHHRGKWVHMGRVNSFARLDRARRMLCDSADGTFVKYGGAQNVERLRGWLERLQRNPLLITPERCGA